METALPQYIIGIMVLYFIFFNIILENFSQYQALSST